jgi:hypothetical protein
MEIGFKRSGTQGWKFHLVPLPMPQGEKKIMPTGYELLIILAFLSLAYALDWKERNKPSHTAGQTQT